MPEIKGLTINLDLDSSGVEKGLSDITKNIRSSTTLLNQANRSLKFDTGNLDAVRQKFSALNQLIPQQNNKLKTLQAELKQLENLDGGTGKFADKINRVNAEILKTTGQIKSYENQLNQLNKDYKIEVDSGNAITGINNIKTSTNDLNKLNFSSFATNFAVAGTAIIGFSKTLSGISGFVNEFDAGADTIIQKTGAIDQSMTNLLKTVAKETGASAAETGAALGEINTRLGFTDEALGEAGVSFLKFAKINGTDVTTSVRLVSRALKDAGIPAEEYSTVLDTLTVAGQKTGISVDTLAESLAKYGAPLRALGFDTKESIALFSEWEAQGVNTEIAISGMKKAIGNFASSGKDARVEFAKTVEEIKKSGNISEATAKSIEVFGAKAGPDLADAIMGGRFEIDKAIQSLEGFEGATDRTFNAMEGDAGGQFARTFNIIKTEIGAAFGGLNDALGGPLKDFNDWLTSIDAGPLLRVGLALGGLATAAIGISALVSGIGALASSGVVAAALAPLGAAIGAISAPVVAVGLAIAGLGVLVYQNFDFIKQQVATITNAFATFWANIQPGLQPIIDFFTKTFNEAISSLLPFLQETWTNINSIFQSAVGAITPLITNVLIPIFKGIVDVFTTYVMPVLIPILEGIKVQFTGLWNAVKIIFSGGLNIITNIFDGFKNLFTGNWSGLWDNVKNIFSTLVSTVGSLFGNFVGTLGRLALDIVPKIIGALSGLPGKLWDTFTNAFNSAKDALTNIDWGKVGSDIVRGIINGIKGAAGWLQEQMGNLANSALNAAKSALGIKSPSRVFRDVVGKQIPAGIAVGVEANTKEAINSVSSMSSDLVNAASFDPTNTKSAINSGVFNTSGAAQVQNTTNTKSINISFGNITINGGNTNQETVKNLLEIIERELGNKLGVLV